MMVEPSVLLKITLIVSGGNNADIGEIKCKRSCAGGCKRLLNPNFKGSSVGFGTYRHQVAAKIDQSGSDTL